MSLRFEKATTNQIVSDAYHASFAIVDRRATYAIVDRKLFYQHWACKTNRGQNASSYQHYNTESLA